MTVLNSYLNFPGNTEEAFNFYKSVFGGEFTGGIMRYKDVPPMPGCEQLSEKDSNAVMHISLPIGGNTLIGTDSVGGMGGQLKEGNNITLSLHPDTKEEADRLYAALSAGGHAVSPMENMFWGDYWGMLTDKFGINWMVNYHKQA